MTGFVYFIENGVGGYIKIGYAFNPEARLETLQCGNPEELFLLAKIPTVRADESRLHRYFRKERITGEWFAPSPKLWKLVRRWWCYDEANGVRDPRTDYRTLSPSEWGLPDDADLPESVH